MPRYTKPLPPPDDRLLTTEQVTELTGYSQRSLRRFRSNHGGPPVTKAAGSRLVRYRRSDVLRWVEQGCP